MLRWLAGYATEGRQRIEDAADLASLLEELAGKPTVVEKLRGYVQRTRAAGGGSNDAEPASSSPQDRDGHPRW